MGDEPVEQPKAPAAPTNSRWNFLNRFNLGKKEAKTQATQEDPRIAAISNLGNSLFTEVRENYGRPQQMKTIVERAKNDNSLTDEETQAGIQKALTKHISTPTSEGEYDRVLDDRSITYYRETLGVSEELVRGAAREGTAELLAKGDVYLASETAKKFNFSEQETNESVKKSILICVDRLEKALVAMYSIATSEAEGEKGATSSKDPVEEFESSVNSLLLVDSYFKRLHPLIINSPEAERMKKALNHNQFQGFKEGAAVIYSLLTGNRRSYPTIDTEEMTRRVTPSPADYLHTTLSYYADKTAPEKVKTTYYPRARKGEKFPAKPLVIDRSFIVDQIAQAFNKTSYNPRRLPYVTAARIADATQAYPELSDTISEGVEKGLLSLILNSTTSTIDGIGLDNNHAIHEAIDAFNLPHETLSKVIHQAIETPEINANPRKVFAINKLLQGQ